MSELGRPPEIGEVPDPVRGEGEALIEVLAVPLNPIDVNVGAGRFYRGHPPLPYVAGCEAVGRVVEAETLAPGTLVWTRGGELGVRRDGGLAERLAVAEDAVVALPEGARSGSRGGARDRGIWRGGFPFRCGRRCGRARRCSCSGRRGLWAWWLSRGRGFSAPDGWSPRVGGRRRSSGRGGLVRTPSCRWTSEDLAGALREACGGDGPNLVIDPLWGEPVMAAVAAAAPHARIVHIGQSAGPAAALLSADVRGKQLDVLGFSNSSTPTEVLVREYLRLVELAHAGELELEIETFPFERVAEAWTASGRGRRRQARGAPRAGVELGIVIVDTLSSRA